MTVAGFTPRYDSESPYKLSQLTDKYLLYYVHRSVRPNQSDRLFKITNERYVNRPDLLASDLYGDPDLFWIVPVRNGLQDPIFDLKIGTVLYIPDPTLVRSLL